ncbi:MAG: hsp90 co-chaperone Cdc37 [Alyxoria varia]|nr:MAG: hsp90 co-chaperone Cdc37 [Alyxoria varia]
MPVDVSNNYSKWDKLEVSDDSDVEVHPNVDKRSFIRAKQSQIHQEREQRKHEIETLRYERTINTGLLERIDALIKAIKKHAEAATGSGAQLNDRADELVFSSLMETNGDPAKDSPPKPPEGVHAKTDQPSYTKMMTALVDQVQKEVNKQKPEDRVEAYTDEIARHKTKVQGLQKQLIEKLTELEKLTGSKITSQDIRTGFDSSSVSKSAQNPTQSHSVELLNDPSKTSTKSEDENTPPAPDHAPLPTREIQPTALGRRFAALPRNDYRSYHKFIMENISVLAERETDGLLMQAFDLQFAGKEADAKQCVHQALLLQYCRGLGGGRDGVDMFFKRIGTTGHQGQKVFYDDVNNTYDRLRERNREMHKDAIQQGTKDYLDENSEVGSEQIQLQPVNPGEKINIVVPAKKPEDEDEKKSREMFETLSEDMQKALETGELDEVNKVLAAMKVDAAEEVVATLSEGGMLSMETGVFDTTTEEGRKALEEMQRLQVENGGEPSGDVEVLEEKVGEGEWKGKGSSGEGTAGDQKKAVDEVD